MDTSPEGETTSRLKIRRLTPAMMREELAEYERQYGMSSEAFYDRFRAGELGDAADFVDWAGACYMALRHGVLKSPQDGTRPALVASPPA